MPAPRQLPKPGGVNAAHSLAQVAAELDQLPEQVAASPSEHVHRPGRGRRLPQRFDLTGGLSVAGVLGLLGQHASCLDEVRRQDLVEDRARTGHGDGVVIVVVHVLLAPTSTARRRRDAVVSAALPSATRSG